MGIDGDWWGKVVITEKKNEGGALWRTKFRLPTQHLSTLSKVLLE
jgi:hypothetical protein